ncbi:MAG TPA: ethanolamine utilization protein EutJ, partial [Bacillales bacterium]|nr:ethanolamine utilization protein EutJ [Bacillales bacterium]
LAKTKDLSLVTGIVTIDKDHNPIKSATVLEYKDGKQVFNTKVNP